MKVFITGGTSGIGLALAKEYLAEGHQVGICGRDLSKVPEELKNQSALSCYEADVVDADQLKEVIDSFAEGTLDLMIASAGRSVGKKSSVPNFSDGKEVMQINVFGVMNTIESSFEIMEKQRSGHIVVIGSVAGFVGLPGTAPYSASKSAVFRLCESYSMDFKHYGIDVTTIAPGFIDTPLTKVNNHPMPFLMTAEKAARKIKKAIEKKKHLYVFPLPMKLATYVLEKIPRRLYRALMGLSFFDYCRNVEHEA